MLVASHALSCLAQGMLKQLFIASVFLSLLSQTVQAQVRVVDGDTIELDGITYRLNGIDAPEHGQKCKTAEGRDWACGKQVTQSLRDFLKGQLVTCEGSQQDGYGRTIGTCFVRGLDLNQMLVYQGMAWAFVKYNPIYAETEQLARQNKRGIWQGASIPPWEYRAAKWEVAAQQAPAGCPIKGNISRNGMIYHAPWSPWYDRTRINEAKGERWFCNEAEALAAGWRAPLWGG